MPHHVVRQKTFIPAGLTWKICWRSNSNT